jgi:hypothetical protein
MRQPWPVLLVLQRVGNLHRGERSLWGQLVPRKL